jgi:hypothetical protein
LVSMGMVLRLFRPLARYALFVPARPSGSLVLFGERSRSPPLSLPER